jgi:glucose/arabinose dehydrogenase
MKRIVLLALLVSAPLVAQNLHLIPIATGLDQPVALTQAGDPRLFITLQRGQIVIFDGTRVLPAPFLDIRSLVACCNERGLLSVAFHPHYATNGFFYVDYTRASDGDVVIARYRVSSDPNRADPASATILLTIDHSEFANHNGGQLQFGPDGYLYVGVGDGGAGGDPHNHAQDLSQLLGKILRLDVDAPAPYVPPSNPFVGRAGARGEVWAYGLRNPWRFSFDRETGDLFIADVGQDIWEEVDFQPRTSIGGENYGWRRMEGAHCYNPATNCVDPSFVMPILEYSHNDGSCSITGGYRYRGTVRMPSMRGAYFYGDYCTGRISIATQSGSAWTTRPLLATTMNISSFGEDINGELYVLDLRGGVYALTEKTPGRHRAASH